MKRRRKLPDMCNMCVCVCVVNQKQEAVGLHIPSAAVLTAYLVRIGSVLVFRFVMLVSSSDPTTVNV